MRAFPVVSNPARDVAGGLIETGWTPQVLFTGGVLGVLYDSSDITALFQDAAATVPVTALGDPVGCIRDKSGNGFHATQSTDANRPTWQQDATGRYFLLFDGLNDGLASGAIDLTATDAMTSFVGMRKLADSATAVVYEFSANSSLNSGVFAMFAPIAGAGVSVRSGGSALSNIGNSAVTFAAPSTMVVTHQARISTDTNSIRTNAGAANPQVTDQGTGNYGNHALFVGSRSGGTLPFNGRIYQFVLLGRAATADEITQTEAFINARTGAY